MTIENVVSDDRKRRFDINECVSVRRLPIVGSASL